ncbi:MAG: ABC transporter permease [Candidatus Neomarinimicrobiota bacterium]
MFSSYLKVAVRNLRKNHVYSVINIVGLAIGIAVCMLILMYVNEESSYDRQISDRLYRLERHSTTSLDTYGGGLASLAPAFGIFLKDDFMEVENVVRLWEWGTKLVEYGDNQFTEPQIFFAEKDVFAAFSIPMISGNAETALAEPLSAAISQSTAQKIFGDEDPIGKELAVSEDLFVNVTDVFEDTPRKSHIHFNFLISYPSLREFGAKYHGGESDYFLGTENITDNVTYTYLTLADGTDAGDFQERMPAFIDRHVPGFVDDSGQEMKASDNVLLNLRHAKDIHLYSHTGNEIEPGGDIRFVRLFLIIAMAILLIACFNFINLATARSAKRAKEVGLRKVVGADRSQLLTQFMCETFFIGSLAMVFAILLIEIALPHFGTIAGYELAHNLWMQSEYLLILLGVFVFVCLAAGIYPAIYLSVFKPAAILRGDVTHGKRGIALRKTLVVIQFTISMGLILSVMVIFNQMRYLKNKELGFDKENVLMFRMHGDMWDRWDDFKAALISETDAISVAASKRAPTGRLGDNPGFTIEINGEKRNSTIAMPHNRVEHDFFKTYGMEIVAGRDFSLEHSTDTEEAFILNETAVRSLGWENPADALGAVISVPSWPDEKAGRVIGVVKDFHYESLHNHIIPIVTYIAPFEVNTVAVRLSPGDIAGQIEAVGRVADRYQPGYDFTFDFLDDRLAAQYRSEGQLMRLFGYFCTLAIFIACLGLIGLSAYAAERRAKELSIRKVLGATVANIAALLSKEFVWLIGLSIVVASPITYYMMTQWLANFAYRIDMGLSTFAISGSALLVTALATVSWQAIKAAISNPVDALKYE